MESIEKNLIRAEKVAEKTGGGILLISEGVFGMRGEQQQAEGNCRPEEKYNFRLFVDDAHGFGTLGKTGAEQGEEQGIQDDIDVYFATLPNRWPVQVRLSPPMMKSSTIWNTTCVRRCSPNPANATGGRALKRLDMIRTMPELRQKLWDNVKRWLAKKEVWFRNHTKLCNTRIPKGRFLKPMALVKDLRETHGIFCSIVVYPVIPKRDWSYYAWSYCIAYHGRHQRNFGSIFFFYQGAVENGTYKRLSAAVAAAMGE